MLKKLIVLFALTLLTRNVYSQFGYTIEGIRYTCITEEELDSTLATYYHLDECREISDTLRSEIKALRNANKAQGNVISIAKQDSTILSEINTTLKKTNDDLLKAVKKEKRKSFFKGAGFGIGLVVVVEAVGVAAYFISKL